MGKDLKGKELGVGLTQRKDGLYQARFTHRGKQYCFYDKKLRILRERVIEEQSKAKDGLDGSMHKVTLNELFQQFYEVCIIPHSRDNTIKAVRIDYYRCNETIGEKYIIDIKQTHIQMVVNMLIEKNYKPSTIVRSFKILRRLFDYAMNMDVIIKNPCKNIILPNDTKAHQRVMTIDEQNLFVESIQDDFYRNLFMVLLSTGIRIGEACALSWDCVDFKKGLIKINKTLISGSAVSSVLKIGEPKTMCSFRDIPMTEDTKRYLKNQLKSQKELRLKLGDKWRGKGEFNNLVFTTSFGSPIIHKVIETHINNVVKGINCLEIIQAKAENRDTVYFEPLSPHAFRRSFASRCFEQGLKPKNVQHILGHSSIQTTLDVYVQIVGNELKSDLDKYQVQTRCVKSV